MGGTQGKRELNQHLKEGNQMIKEMIGFCKDVCGLFAASLVIGAGIGFGFMGMTMFLLNVVV